MAEGKEGPANWFIFSSSYYQATTTKKKATTNSPELHFSTAVDKITTTWTDTLNALFS
jgi:hypothetical protein